MKYSLFYEDLSLVADRSLVETSFIFTVGNIYLLCVRPLMCEIRLFLRDLHLSLNMLIFAEFVERRKVVHPR